LTRIEYCLDSYTGRPLCCIQKMASLVRIHRKRQMTLPTRLRAQAGISEGDLVEAAFHRGKIVLTPTLAIDRSKFTNADDKYTPEQRRIIDARLAESEEDLKQGRTFGPFNTAEEMITSMKAQLRKRSAVKRTKLSR
jgi:bifunctional DNA-binding transcriptional regulator/antitoxin component of YhaV-PrlF toxin-antitoxin module